MKTSLSLISLLLIVFGLLASNLFKTDSPAPHVTFSTISGKKIKLSSLKGKPAIVTFWATDCASCIEEIPHLIDIYKEFHPKGLEIIAVAMYYDPPNHVVNMSKAKQIPYEVALDLKAEHAVAFGQVELTPTTFLISPAGDIVMQTTGLFNMADMRHKIQQLITG